MENTQNSFYGQQEGEIILYATTPHPIGMWIGLAKIYLGAMAVWLAAFMIGSQLPQIMGKTGLMGFILGGAIALIGTLTTIKMQSQAIAYITDRRIVRFQSHNPFATVSRALSWDQAVKVKTFPPNVMYKMLMIGSVIVHSKSTVINTDSPLSQNGVSNDDLELEDVYYYKDLGNYIDKIIYLYNREPEKLKEVKPFVPKPKGMRY